MSIIALSRHADRQALATTFGATDIVEVRGEEAEHAVLDLTDGVGVDEDGRGVVRPAPAPVGVALRRHGHLDGVPEPRDEVEVLVAGRHGVSPRESVVARAL